MSKHLKISAKSNKCCGALFETLRTSQHLLPFFVSTKSSKLKTKCHFYGERKRKMRKFFLTMTLMALLIFSSAVVYAQTPLVGYIENFIPGYDFLYTTFPEEGSVSFSALCPKETAGMAFLQKLLRQKCREKVYITLVDAHCVSIGIKWWSEK